MSGFFIGLFVWIGSGSLCLGIAAAIFIWFIEDHYAAKK